MDPMIIPPCPNWYEPNAFKCTPDNTIIYGVWNNIVIVNPKNNDVQNILMAHAEKIYYIDVSPNWSSGQMYVVTVGMDKIIKIWDIPNKVAIGTLTAHANSKTKIVGAVFCGSERVFSVTEDGVMIVWKYAQNEITKHFWTTLGPHIVVKCLAACPHAGYIVAVGTKKGEIFIVNAKDFKSARKLLTSYKALVTLAWCPSPFNYFDANITKKEDLVVSAESTVKDDEEKIESNIAEDVDDEVDSKDEKKNIRTIKKDPESTYIHKNDSYSVNIDDCKREYILVSSDISGTLTFWRPLTDNRVIHKVQQKESYRKNYRKSKDKSQMQDYTPIICWTAPTVICLSNSREVYYYDYLTRTKQPTRLHNEHENIVFGVASPFTQKENEWYRDDATSVVWSYGKDRLLQCTSVPSNELVYRYPTLGQTINAVSSFPVDPTMLAIGCGDGTLSLWNLSYNSNEILNFKNIALPAPVKILHLAWHPVDDRLIAFGSAEGTVGVVKLKPHKIIKFTPLKQGVHSLQWAPYGDQKYVLFVCAEGKVFAYKERVAEVIDLKTEQIVTHIEWQPAHSLFALGTRSGTILLYNKNFEPLSPIYSQTKSIGDLSWHPASTFYDESEEVTIESYWLASVSISDPTIYVYHTKAIIDQNPDDLIVCKFDSHASPVKVLSWSPFHTNQLASFSEDGTARIYDCHKKTTISVYINHFLEPLQTGMFSTIHENFIIIAGRDNILRTWNIAEGTKWSEESIQKLRGMRRALIDTLKKKEPVIVDEENALIKNKKRALGDTFLHAVANRQRNNTEVFADCDRLLKAREKAVVEEEGETVEQCEEASEFDLSTDCVVKLFGTSEEVNVLLKAQENEHYQRQRHQAAANVALATGDLEHAVRIAITNGTLTPWLISLAPAVSISLWQEACAAYAKSLSDNLTTSNALEAASYFLTCNKPTEAVEVLCTAKSYRDALAIARSRYLDETVVGSIMQRWAQNATITGQFEIAAQVNVALGNMREAASILFKRSDLEALDCALKLAKASGDGDLEQAIVKKREEVECETKKTEELKPLASIVDVMERLNIKADEERDVEEAEEEVDVEVE